MAPFHLVRAKARREHFPLNYLRNSKITSITFKKFKFILFCLFFLISFYITGSKILNTSLINYLIYNEEQISSMKYNNMLKEISKSIVNDVVKETTILDNNIIINKNNSSFVNLIKKDDYKVYIYNTLDEESYSNKGFEFYNTTHTVKLASYMLKDELKNLGINALVEERPVIKEIKKQGLPYHYSYDISNKYCKEIKEKYNLKKSFPMGWNKGSLKNWRQSIPHVTALPPKLWFRSLFVPHWRKDHARKHDSLGQTHTSSSESALHDPGGAGCGFGYRREISEPHRKGRHQRHGSPAGPHRRRTERGNGRLAARQTGTQPGGTGTGTVFDDPYSPGRKASFSLSYRLARLRVRPPTEIP